eukprot:TRINITY_DN19461_c0_g1_i1.p1 TRINITY_DN19461_c0_g1~~TRINITY_DN19461_c0_g1_i1.p1  ORF type:complete len:521 (+),score=31.89 TRINITY_DN19461_c0_g1_i1:37-1563(+)
MAKSLPCRSSNVAQPRRRLANLGSILGGTSVSLAARARCVAVLGSVLHRVGQLKRIALRILRARSFHDQLESDRSESSASIGGAGVAHDALVPDGKRTSLSALPHEVLSMTFACLRRNNLVDLGRASSTCKTFKSLCTMLLWRAYACRQCNMPLFHPRDHFFRQHSLSGILEDGAAVACRLTTCGDSTTAGAMRPPSLSMFESEYIGLSKNDAQEWRLIRRLARTEAILNGEGEGEDVADDAISERYVGVHRLSCPRCHLYLGETMTRAPQPEEGTGGHNPWNLASICKGLGESMSRTTQKKNSAGNRNLCDIAFICKSYIHLVDTDGPCAETPELIYCNGRHRRHGIGYCGQALFSRQDVLSRQHCWTLPGGPLEAAWYVNGLLFGSVAVGESRSCRLAQGRMDVADVSCSKCHGVIGWQFVRDLSTWRVNRSQVGRFGICTSSMCFKSADQRVDVSDDEEYEETEEWQEDVEEENNEDVESMREESVDRIEDGTALQSGEEVSHLH